ncbi:MAG: WGR domain-containing protein [Candidatus Yanofskybacteria bacterium]|nr:WGR domain-containing protein [Candidatus Yanofskybacteria bacterium]
MKIKHNSGRYELVDRNSKKFWEATWKDKKVTVRFGRIGTVGQTLRKTFFNDVSANSYFHDKIEEKCRKGYKLVGTATYPQSDSNSLVICHSYVGEHTEEVAKGLCRWLTKCLKKKMPVIEFEKIWMEFRENDEGAKAVPGFTIVYGEKEYWSDNLDFSEDLVLDSIYKKAVEKGADRFITFNSNGFTDIVAIRGKPTPREIATLVLGSEENARYQIEEDVTGVLS